MKNLKQKVIIIRENWIGKQVDVKYKGFKIKGTILKVKDNGYVVLSILDGMKIERSIDRMFKWNEPKPKKEPKPDSYVIRGSEDGVIAVATSAKRAIEIAVAYLIQGTERTEDDLVTTSFEENNYDDIPFNSVSRPALQRHLVSNFGLTIEHAGERISAEIQCFFNNQWGGEGY